MPFTTPNQSTLRLDLPGLRHGWQRLALPGIDTMATSSCETFPSAGICALPENHFMNWKIWIAFFALTLMAQGQTPSTGPKRPFTFEDMMSLKRLSEPVPSPDGKWVVFAAVDVDLGANTKVSHLWIIPAAGGTARRLNQTPNHEERPRFSTDGTKLIWTSKATDPPQIWMSNFTSESGGLDGTPHQVTNIATGADGGIWTPDGKNIVFVSSVYPDCKDVACNQRRDEDLSKS
jgi:hypothetical protein